MKLLSQTYSVLRHILRNQSFVLIAVVAAIILAYINYWLLTQVTTIPEFLRMTQAGEFGRYSILYTTVFILMNVLVPILFGLLSAVLVWQFQHSKLRALKYTWSGGLGAIASAFGAACPVCGAFLLALLGVTGGVSLFPLKGLEFQFLSFALLAGTLVYSARKTAPLIDGTCTDCVVPTPSHHETAHGKHGASMPLEKTVTSIVILLLLINHILIGQVVSAFGFQTKSVGKFLGTLVSPSSAAAKSIIATKLNPDGRTTTIGTWPTITEVPAEPKTGDVVVDARVVMVPTGTPFYVPEGISFDDPVGALQKWQPYERSIQLTGELETRYQKIVGTMTCDYCCGGATRVTVINNCGCAHSGAYRSIAKYILQSYADTYSDDEIIGELQRWKGAWYPKGVIEDYLLATGRGDVLGHATHGGAGSDGRHGF